jgi:membrane protein DedA with SNARE-associated domain
VLNLLLTRGLAVVCAASFLESLGAPVPAFPLLLLAGSIAAEHRFSAVPLVAGGRPADSANRVSQSIANTGSERF